MIIKTVDMNNDNYLFLFADGNADNALVFSEEELAKKKVILMMLS